MWQAHGFTKAAAKSEPLQRLCTASRRMLSAKTKAQIGMNTRLPGGLPDFVEKWSPAAFRKVGVGLVAGSLLGVPLAYEGLVSILMPTMAGGFTALYWKVGLSDI
ncbi:unnamed protein product, partial [Polarella glacialis]